jgi:HD-GYP domain-containing protein (c-di-GMP phosphodiesterase class II)
MDMRDRSTARHADDVVSLARRVGELLELEPASLMELEFAARLHDVGKIQVPDAVLNKPGPLEPEESDVIRCHSAWGSETLARIPGLEAVATIVRYLADLSDVPDDPSLPLRRDEIEAYWHRRVPEIVRNLER